MTTLEVHDHHRTTPASHEHAWITESSHRTSEGLVRYVRCGVCGGRRVDLQAHPEAPPAALSETVPRKPAEGSAPGEPRRKDAGTLDMRVLEMEV